MQTFESDFAGIVTRTIPKAELTGYIAKPDLFQHPSWLNAVEDGVGYKCFGLHSSRYGEPVCLNIFFSCTKGGVFRLAGSPLAGSFTPYMEPIRLAGFEDSAMRDVVEAQNRHLREMGFSYIERRVKQPSHYPVADIHGCEFSIPETYIVSLDGGIEDVWKRMQGRCRTSIRKAEKSGVAIMRCDGTQSEVETFYEMLKGVFSKSGTQPPHPISMYRSIVSKLMPEGRLLILSASESGKTVAMGLFIFDDTEIHYLSGASLPEAYASGANYLIQWELLKHAIAKGLQYYDMEGKGIAAIDKFKESFGGKVHSFGRTVWKTRTAALAESVFNEARTLKKRFFRPATASSGV